MDSNSNENVQYFKLSKTITDGEKDGNISKIIKRVAKNVVIDKTVAMATAGAAGAAMATAATADNTA
jgi:hypothetical protein